MLPLLYHSELSLKDARERAFRYLKHFDLYPARDMRPGAVSSGTRKACSLARAFMLRPKMLVLDEPTLGLGRGAVEHLVQMIELHQKEFGLKHVIIGTEDELFLSYFDFHTIDIQNHQLKVVGRQIRKEASGGR